MTSIIPGAKGGVIPSPPPTPTPSTPIRGYEIDLAGSGGSLSNGTVSIDGVDWTIGGVGTSTLVYLETDLANFFADYDGSIHSFELTGNVTNATLGDTAGVFGFIRLDSTDTYGQYLINYMVGGGTFQQCRHQRYRQLRRFNHVHSARDLLQGVGALC